jgi:hypothetical protein
MASTYAEVGNENDPARQAYIESVMNCAVSRNMSLNATLSSAYNPVTKKGYYPPETISQLNRQPSQAVQDNLNPMIDRALSGSNIAKFATGNQSPPVTSGDAPITFDPKAGEKGDTFVIEPATSDKNWAGGMRRQQAAWRATGQPVAPAVNIMGGYGEGAGSAAEPEAEDDSSPQSSSSQLGGHLGAVNA